MASNARHRHLSWVLISLCIGLSGCLPYPVYKKLQPEIRFTVMDEAEKPIAGARVHLITKSYPYGFEDSREIRITQSAGTATFSDRREWTTEALVIHGRKQYFWNWCVEKDGYATYHSTFKSGGDKEDHIKISLKTGGRTECPIPLNY